MTPPPVESATFLQAFLAFGLGAVAWAAVEAIRRRSRVDPSGERVRASEERARTATMEASHASAVLAAAVESAVDSMHAVNATLTLSAYNEAFRVFVIRALHGEPALGVPIDQLYPTRERPAWAARYNRALAGTEVELDYPVRGPDGGNQIFEVCLSPIRMEGTIVGVVVTGRDATHERQLTEQLRESEQHFRALIEHATDVVMLLGRDSGIRYASPSIAGCLGWTPEEAVGRGVLMLTHPDDVEPVRATIQAVEHDPGTPGRLQFRLRHKDGTWRDLEATFSARVLHTGETTFVVNARDVSEREALQGELRQRQRGASLGRLVAGVAHDFNNVLTAILGNTALARATADNAELEAIDLAGKRGRELVGQLESFAGQSGGAPEVFSPAKRIASVHGMLSRLLGDDVALDTHLGELDWNVRMAPKQFDQLLVNLALAGRAVMPAGGTITVETGTTKVTQQFVGRHPYVRTGEYVVVNVVDQGETTLDDEEKYSPAAEDARASLAVCDELMHRSGGYMWIYREKGFGSSYRLFLPRHVDAPVGGPRLTPVSTAPVEEPVGGTETVLLVEDDPAIRSLTARALRQGGYHVLDAVNGRDALEISRTHVGPLHLVLSDLVMPQMNGDELLIQIRAKRASTRLVLMSGYAASVARPERLKAMNVQFLDKPFTPDLLLKRVRAALDAPA